MLRDQTLKLLGKHGVTAEATFDEQQLVDPSVITAMIDASGLKCSDIVLEIGPGAGNITSELAKRAKKVYAVEKNLKFLPPLNERIGEANVEIILGNALNIYLPPFDVLVSNLPYAIIEALLQRLKRLRFRVASLLVPISFANIITAHRGEPTYSKLSLETQLFYDVFRVAVIKQSAYHPKPKTETVLVALRPRAPKTSPEVVLWHLLQQGDKKVSNALREALITSNWSNTSSKRAAKGTVAKLGLDIVDLEKRVVALSLRDVEFIISRLEKNAA